MSTYLIYTTDGEIIHSTRVCGDTQGDIDRAQGKLPEWTHSVSVHECVTVTLRGQTRHIVLSSRREGCKFSTLGGSLSADELITMIKVAQNFENERS